MVQFLRTAAGGAPGPCPIAARAIIGAAFTRNYYLDGRKIALETSIAGGLGADLAARITRLAKVALLVEEKPWLARKAVAF